MMGLAAEAAIGAKIRAAVMIKRAVFIGVFSHFSYIHTTPEVALRIQEKRQHQRSYLCLMLPFNVSKHLAETHRLTKPVSL